LAIVCLVLGIYSLFGFRPVVVLADALVGGFIGLLCGGTLALFLMWLKLVRHDLALWALVLIPLGAVVVPLYRAQSDQPRVHDAEGQATESQTVEK
jgi:hypothetical protein